MSRFIRTHWTIIREVASFVLLIGANVGWLWLKDVFVTREEFATHRSEYLLMVSNVVQHCTTSPLIVQRLEAHDAQLDRAVDGLDGRVRRLEVKGIQ